LLPRPHFSHLRYFICTSANLASITEHHIQSTETVFFTIMAPPKVTRKRVSDTPKAEISTKRVKPSSDDNETKHQGPRTPRKSGPVLDMSAPVPTVEGFINERALSLFDNVKVLRYLHLLMTQDLQEFRVAAILFWTSYFAYQRGQPLAVRKQLFAIATKRIDRKRFGSWNEYETQCFDVWENEHELLIAGIEKAYNSLLNKWLESPAGQNYRDMIEAARYYPFRASSGVLIHNTLERARSVCIISPQPISFSSIAKKTPRNTTPASNGVTVKSTHCFPSWPN